MLDHDPTGPWSLNTLMHLKHMELLNQRLRSGTCEIWSGRMVFLCEGVDDAGPGVSNLLQRYVTARSADFKTFPL